MRYHSAGKFIFYWLAILLALAMTTAASAKSLYMLANHHTNQFDAWNINPDGTVTYQATYGLSFTQEPSGLALDADSGTLFFTDEFNVPGQDPAIEMVDAVSMKSLGSVVPRGRDGRPVRDLAGIDVDDKHNIVYIVQRRRPDIYVYDWDPNFIVVNPTNPDEVIVDSRAMTLRDGYPQALPGVVGAFGIALDERAGVLYVADSRDRKVKGFNTNTWEEVLNFTPTGLVPGGIAVDRRKGIIYTTAPDLAVEECCFGLRNVFGPEGSTKISKYDLATGLETVMDMSLAGLNHGGMGIWVDEVTGYLYVTGGCTGDDLTIWDTSTPTSPDIPFTLVHASGPIGNPAALAIGNISYNPLHLTIPQEECAKPGESITYTICYDNMDNEDYVTNVRIVDKLPDQDKVSFVEATDGGVYDEATHTVTWNVDELPGGSRQCIRVVVQVNPAIPSTAILKSFVTITSDQTPQPTTVVDERSVCCLPGNCPPIGITVDYIDPDRCMAAVSWTEPTFENCDGPLIVTVQAVYPDGSTRDNVKPGDLFPITCGTPGTIVTYTAWDSVDDRVIGQCSFPIEILDQPPVVDYCPADIVQCSAQVTWELPRFRDDCVLPPVPGKAVYPDGSTSDDVQPGDTFPIGTTIITYTAEDRCGNTASCTFKVTVGGDEPLTCTCPSDITVNNDPGRCGAAVGWELPSCSDNCGEIFTVTCDHEPGTFFPVGTTPVSCTVTGDRGTVHQCSFNVTVVDNTPPVARCKDITVYLGDDGMATITPYDVNNGSSDNCRFTKSIDRSTFTCEDAVNSPIDVTLTVSDGIQSATCIARVTVVDDTPATCTCPSDITVNNDPGRCGAAVGWELPSCSDNCGEVFTATCDHEPGTFFPVGTTPVSCTVTGDRGTVHQCSFNVTVVDNTPPVARCKDITVYLGDDGMATITPYDVNNGSSDNCRFTKSIDRSTFTCEDVVNSPIDVTLTVSDGIQSATCIAKVTVVDDTPATCTCPSDITVNNDPGRCGAAVKWELPSCSDNCGEVFTATCDHEPGTFFPVGTTPVSCTVTGDRGTVHQCSFNVTVVDNTPPVARCKDITVYLGDDGMATITPYDVNNGSSDNCRFTKSIDRSTFTCEDVVNSPIDVTLTVSDGIQSATCIARVTVVDDVSPVVTIKPLAKEYYTTDVVALEYTVTDINNCDPGPAVVVTLSNNGNAPVDISGLSPISLNMAELAGKNVITVTAMDKSGNAGSASVHFLVTSVPSTPAPKPRIPVKTPGTPIETPGTPVKVPSAPVQQPSIQIQMPSTPAQKSLNAGRLPKVK